MTIRLLGSVAEFVFIVGCLYLALRIYARHRLPKWSEPLEKHRHYLLLALACAVMSFEVIEDVLDEEAGPIDEELLLFIHTHVPSSCTGAFEAITLSGSYKVMGPLAAAAVIGLLYIRRRTEALIIAVSVIGGAGIIFVVKTAVGRDRPALWPTEWYWGSSFPSGHTLAVAAFATAAVVCVGRLWPARQRVAAWTALAWIVLVGLSRLVLGVHWPSDVLAAACIGASLPLVTSLALALRQGSSPAT